MDLRAKWKAAGRNPTVKLFLLFVGLLLLATAPVVGVVPGPGGNGLVAYLKRPKA